MRRLQILLKQQYNFSQKKFLYQCTVDDVNMHLKCNLIVLLVIMESIIKVKSIKYFVMQFLFQKEINKRIKLFLICFNQRIEMKTSFTLSSLHHTRNPPHLLLLKKIEVWMEGDTTPNTIQINIHRYSLIVEQHTYYILIDLFGIIIVIVIIIIIVYYQK